MNRGVIIVSFIFAVLIIGTFSASAFTFKFADWLIDGNQKVTGKATSGAIGCSAKSKPACNSEGVGTYKARCENSKWKCDYSSCPSGYKLETKCTSSIPKSCSSSCTKVAVTTKTTSKKTTSSTSVYSCSSSSEEFKCQKITQGAYNPNSPAPTVCGCAPKSCPKGEFVIASSASGTWPDGRLKGSFMCSRFLPA